MGQCWADAAITAGRWSGGSGRPTRRPRRGARRPPTTAPRVGQPWVAACTLRLPLVVNVLEHTSQRNGRTPVCVREWICSALALENGFRQTEHGWCLWWGPPLRRTACFSDTAALRWVLDATESSVCALTLRESANSVGMEGRSASNGCDEAEVTGSSSSWLSIVLADRAGRCDLTTTAELSGTSGSVTDRRRRTSALLFTDDSQTAKDEGRSVPSAWGWSQHAVVFWYTTPFPDSTGRTVAVGNSVRPWPPVRFPLDCCDAAGRQLAASLDATTSNDLDRGTQSASARTGGWLARRTICSIRLSGLSTSVVDTPHRPASTALQPAAVAEFNNQSIDNR